MRLILLRHAKSAWPEGVDDEWRPLAGRGRRDAPAVGRWLAEHAPDPGAVLVSPAVRARQTWELAAVELPAAPAPLVDPRLYFSGPEGIADAIRERDADTVLVVAHNPDLEDLVAELTGERVVLKTATAAVLSGTPDLARVTLDEVVKIRG